MRQIKVALSAALLAFTLSATADNLPNELEKVAKELHIPLNSISVSVKPIDAPNKAPLVSFNAERSISPASTEKLITTLAALELLGPNYHWVSKFYADQEPTDDGHVKALYLQGSGDPTWVVEDFILALDRLSQLGVKHIDGDLIVDRSLFNVPPEDPDAFDGRGDRPYNQMPDALLINYNALSFELLPIPGKAKARVVMIPKLAGVELPESIELTRQACGDWKGNLRFTIEDLGNGQKRVVFKGTFPEACGPKLYTVVSMDKNEYIERLFREIWERDGRTWSGHVREATLPSGLKEISYYSSKPLREVIALANKWSNNQIARHLFLMTAGTHRGLPPDQNTEPKDLEDSRVAVMTWLKSVGVNTNGFVLDNGSGLSRTSRVTADGMTQMLLAGWRSPYMSEYLASLPISGVDGTMRKRKTATHFAHVKTGFLSDVRAIGGYVQNKDGKRFVVYATVEGNGVGGGIPFLDQVIAWVHDQP